MADVKSPALRVLFVVERDDFSRLFGALADRGYSIVGPTVRAGAIVYDEVARVEELPAGWTDEQADGTYRLQRRADNALFGYTVGPHAWKQFLHPPVQRLWQAQRDGDGFALVEEERPVPLLALLGVRACELQAIQIQDRIYLSGPHVDLEYQRRRAGTFIVAVNCGKAGGTCFCASMDAGPQVGPGYDLALTEVVESERHYFVVEVGSDRGAGVLAELPHRLATEAEQGQAAAIVAATAGQMGRTLHTGDLKELLYRNFDHPHWDAVAARCLACGNCTMVCPTCFCHTVEDTTDLTGEHAERWRKVDSCFTTSFSFISSGSLRTSVKARYRQWLTHKLASWVDQFGTFGCVGCGRCITWCPVGIDITAEVASLRAADVGASYAESSRQAT